MTNWSFLQKNFMDGVIPPWTGEVGCDLIFFLRRKDDQTPSV
jgi:hypothetical protein